MGTPLTILNKKEVQILKEMAENSNSITISNRLLMRIIYTIEELDSAGFLHLPPSSS